ncbi:hypothetical protein ACFWYW_59205 [Nonomuraea sp. NPDC059023]|uniref:hypothetical protein n=1 Tax=unclassified Nonomuraea TaxID=2593643 RepID=UPI0036C5051F
MSTSTYQIRYHPDLGWWDGRYRVYLVGQYYTGLIGCASTKWGARRLIKYLLARDAVSQAYTVVGSVQAPALPGEQW